MFSFKKLPLILTAAVAAFTLPSTHAQPEILFCQLLRDKTNYSTILTLLEDTKLCLALDILGGPYTLFAPENAAFDALSTESLECLTNNNDTLKDLLLYHVINDFVFEIDIRLGLDVFDIGSSKTLDGDKLIEFTSPGTGSIGPFIFINEDTKIIEPDLDDDLEGKHIICL